MAGYSELIKNFEKIRSFTRDLFVYGYKGRSDYTELSPRSYDNERRRIESYLSDLVIKTRDKRGQIVSLSSNTLATCSNPLFKVWETKSFTKKDCFLHFVLLDILSKQPSLGVTELTEIISSEYIPESGTELAIDAMTVRNKLNEYTSLGILDNQKVGKSLYYSIAQNPLNGISKETKESLDLALAYFKNLLPTGFFGHSLNREQVSPFIYRQVFFAQILDDEFLLQILQAIREQKSVNLTLFSTGRNREVKASSVPLKILVNTKTGRRYVAVYSQRRRKFSTFRLDYIKDLKLGSVFAEHARVKAEFENSMRTSFCIMHQTRETPHYLKVLFNIDEKTEQYVLARIKREGKHGNVTRVAEDEFEYYIEIADTMEMVPWLRTFIGRIIEIEGSETHVITQFKRDLSTLAAMYSETLLDSEN